MADQSFDIMISMDASGAVREAKRVDKSLKGVGDSAKKADKNIDKLTKEQKQAAMAAKKQAAATDKLNMSLKRTGKGAALLAAALPGIGGAIVLTSAIRQLSAFQTTMSSVEAVTGAAGDQLDALKMKAREMGAATQFSAVEAAEGMKFLGMAGFETNEILASIEDTLNLAKAGALGLGEAADIASNILSGFALEASEMGRVADVMATAAANSNTNIQQLGDAMKYAAPIAQSLGISIEETAAAIGVLANAGLQGSLGGTGLKIAMQKLLDVTPKGEKALKDMGLTVKDISPEFNSLTDILTKFGEKGLTATAAAQLFGARGSGAMTILAKAAADADGELFKLLQKMDMANGSAADMAETMANNLGGRFKEFTSAVSELYQQLGDAGLSEVLMTTVVGMRDFVRGMILMQGRIENTEVSFSGAYKTGIVFRDTITTIWKIISNVAPWAGLAIAVWGVNAALVAATATAGFATVKFFALQAALTQTAVAAGFLTTSLTALTGLGLGVLIGKWLRSFEAVQLYVNDMVAMFTHFGIVLASWSDKAGIHIDKFVTRVKNGMLEGQAQISEFFAKLSLTDAGEQARLNEAASYRAQKEALGEFDKALEAVNKRRDDAIKINNATTASLAAKIKADFAARNSTDAYSDALDKANKHGIALDKALGMLEGTFTRQNRLNIAFKNGVNSLWASFKDGSVTIDEYYDGVKLLHELWKANTDVIEQNNAALKDTKVGYDALSQDLQGLIQKYEPVIALEAQHAATLAEIEANKKDLVAAGVDVDKVLRLLEKDFKRAKDAASGLDSNIQGLVDSLDPLGKLTREYDQNVADLIDRQKELEAEGYDVAELLEKLEANYKRATIEAQRNEAASYPWAAAWENAIKRLDDAFFDLWMSAFDGASDFIDQLENLFKTFAAQTFHAIFTKPILEGITNMVSGAGFFTNAGEGAFSASGFGKIFDAGRGAVEGFGDGGGITGAWEGAKTAIGLGSSGSLTRIWNGFDNALASGLQKAGLSGLVNQAPATATFNTGSLPLTTTITPAVTQGAPQFASTLPGIEQTLPSTVNVMPTVSQGIPSVPNTLPGTTQTMPVTVDVVSFLDQSTPSLTSTLPGVNQTLPASIDVTSSWTQAYPSIPSTLPGIDQTLPANIDVLSSWYQQSPTLPGTLPGVNQTLPANIDVLSAWNQQVPTLPSTLPGTNQTMTSTIDVFSSWNQPTPTLPGTLPGSSQSMPVYVDVVTFLDETTPTLPGTLPGIDQTLPSTIDVTSAWTQTLPDIPGTLPGIDQTLTSNIDVFSAWNQQVPQLPDMLAGIDQTVPTTIEITGDWFQTLPDFPSTLPGIDQTATSTIDVVSAWEQTLPDFGTTLPGIDQSVISNIDVVGSLNQTMPPIPTNLPGINQTIPSNVIVDPTLVQGATATVPGTLPAVSQTLPVNVTATPTLTEIANAGYTMPVTDTGLPMQATRAEVTGGVGTQPAPGTVNWGQVGASIAAGFVGSYAGQEVFANEGSTGIGAAAGGYVGGVIGSAFFGQTALGVGIGTFLGEGLEKVLGDVFGFGGKAGNNTGAVSFNLGEGEFGRVSDPYGVGNWDGDNGRAAQQLAQALQLYGGLIGGSDLQGEIKVSSRQGIMGDFGKFETASDFFNTVVDQVIDGSDGLSMAAEKVLKAFEGTGDEHLQYAALIVQAGQIFEGAELDRVINEMGAAAVDANGKMGEYAVATAKMILMIEDQRTATEKLTEAQEVQEAAQWDMLKAYKSSVAGVQALINSYDHTKEAAVELADALMTNQELLLQFTSQVNAVKATIETNTDQLLEPIRAMFRPFEWGIEQTMQQADKLFAEIISASDPAVVAGNVSQIQELWGEAFGNIFTSLVRIRDIAAGLSGMFEDTARSFLESTLDTSALEKLYQDDINALLDSLPSLSTASEVEQVATQIDGLTEKLWGLIPDEDRASNLDRFTTFLDDVNMLVSDVLTDIGTLQAESLGIELPDGATLEQALGQVLQTYVGQLEALETHSMNRLDSILDGMEESNRNMLNNLSTKIQKAGDTNIEAANLQQAAAEASMNAANAMSAAVSDIRVNVTVTETSAYPELS